MPRLLTQTSLNNPHRDFDFTASQYQDVSTKAADLAAQVSELKSAKGELKRRASDEQSDERRDLADKEDKKRDLAKIAELEAELANRESVLRRVEEEVKVLRKGRGVQTRGSSVQPRDVGMLSGCQNDPPDPKCQVNFLCVWGRVLLRLGSHEIAWRFGSQNIFILLER